MSEKTTVRKTCYQKLNEIDYSAENEINEAKTYCENKIVKLKKNTKKVYVFLCCFFIALSIVTGIFLGGTVFRYKDTEDFNVNTNVPCYITDTGNCYHTASCSFLYSKHQTTVEMAVKNGYKPCSHCSPPNYRTVKRLVNKDHPAIGILVSSVVSVCIFIIIQELISKSNQEKESTWKYNRDSYIENTTSKAKVSISNIFDNYDLLRIVGAPKSIKIQGGKLCSENENMYRYYSLHGTHYHSKSSCVYGPVIKEFEFELPNLYPCEKCAEIIPDVPEWYVRYKNVVSLIKKYEIEKYDYLDTDNKQY